RGEKPLIGKYKGKLRRWFVERTNSWHNRFRVILLISIKISTVNSITKR
ncbi:hypothetical protein LEP1GSC166_0651, partial [Leptospira kirschneri]